MVRDGAAAVEIQALAESATDVVAAEAEEERVDTEVKEKRLDTKAGEGCMDLYIIMCTFAVFSI